MELWKRDYRNLCFVKVMSPEFQTAIALGLVVAAAAFFVTRWLRARKKTGCGGGCGCSSSKRF